jgi:DNA-binding transcriptional ArsR family regulator
MCASNGLCCRFSFPFFPLLVIFKQVSSLNPTLWRTCRVIANDARLKLLRILFEEGENSVTMLGRQTALAEPHASLHLRLLSSRGLITPRSVDKWVYYSATPNRAVNHASEILNALEQSFADAEMDNGKIVETATAFTHPRRLVIARHLQHGALPAGELSSRTKISPRALYRHLAKLATRRIVQFENDLYFLGKPSKPLGATLLSIATTQQ